MSTEILCCPFCAAPGHISFFFGWHHARCSECAVELDDAWRTWAEAVAAWNTRAGAPLGSYVQKLIDANIKLTIQNERLDRENRALRFRYE